jgi:hypothetical protein
VNVIELFVFCFAHGRSVAVYARIVEGCIESTVGSYCLLDHPPDLAPIRNVAGDGKGPMAR